MLRPMAVCVAVMLLGAVLLAVSVKAKHQDPCHRFLEIAKEQIQASKNTHWRFESYEGYHKAVDSLTDYLTCRSEKED